MKHVKILIQQKEQSLSYEKQMKEMTFHIEDKEQNITEIIEHSAGNGSFSNQITNCIAYDLVPESDNIKTADFLDMKLGYKSGRLFIGNIKE